MADQVAVLSVRAKARLDGKPGADAGIRVGFGFGALSGFKST